jgi:drug/metabolite transporter (DMT)-like permease
MSFSPHHRGMLLCALSAVAFGAMAVFAKEAYAAGVSVVTLLSLRFVLAAAAFWVIAAARGARRGGGTDFRTVIGGLALGAFGYAAQGGCYFGALTRLDAGLTSLLTYIYPILVFAGAFAIGRERATSRRVGALGLATAGTVLVLAGGSVGAIDGLGVALAISCAVVYAAYILMSDRMVGNVDPFVLAGLITTGAAVSTTTVGAASGSLSFGFGAGGWLWILALAWGSTVLGIAAFLSGMKAVGPATASIVSTVEPAVTVGLAMALYGESLGPSQIAGGVLVLGAVVVLQLRPAGSVDDDAAADHAPAVAPARALAHEPA